MSSGYGDKKLKVWKDDINGAPVKEYDLTAYARSIDCKDGNVKLN